MIQAGKLKFRLNGTNGEDKLCYDRDILGNRNAHPKGADQSYIFHCAGYVYLPM